MRHGVTKSLGWAFLLTAMLVVIIALASTAVGATRPLSNEAPVQTPNIFAPTSAPAFAIRNLSWFVLGICAAIFVVVGGLLTYSVIRFRRRPGQDSREPPQVYRSNQIEALVSDQALRTVIPAMPGR
jgi:heme/copper-type cytochrome/quinol oxidase subunit 2